MRFEYDVLLVDGRVRKVVAQHCNDRHTGVYLRDMLSQELVRQGEQVPMRAFTFTNAVL